MTMVSLTWPSVHLLKLSPVGDTQPEVFGLTWTFIEGRETEADFRIIYPARVRMLCDTLKALAPTMGGDQQRILAGAEKRLRAALVSFSIP